MLTKTKRFFKNIVGQIHRTCIFGYRFVFSRKKNKQEVTFSHIRFDTIQKVNIDALSTNENHRHYRIKTFHDPRFIKTIEFGVVPTILIALGVFVFLLTANFFVTHPTLSATSADSQFAASSDATFNLSSGGLVRTKGMQTGFGKVVVGSSSITATVTNDVINTTKVATPEITSDSADSSNFNVTVPQPNQFRPGEYTLNVTIHTPKIAQTLTQNFEWGVLAINPDKSIYTTGDTASIAMGVLDNQGHMVCDGAKLTLQVVDPSGNITTLSTANGLINESRETCYAYTNTNPKPDYYASYKTTLPGKYILRLHADTPAGARDLQDGFMVENDPMFDVERIDQTRIAIAHPVDVDLRVTANTSFSGEVQETVPASFTVEPGNFVDQTTGDQQTLTWNTSFSMGETQDLTYTYHAPNISPQFYTTGPLTFISGGGNSLDSKVVFQEARQWEIAADANSCYTTAVSADTAWQSATWYTTGGTACAETYPGLNTSGDSAYIIPSTAGSYYVPLSASLTTYPLASVCVDGNTSLACTATTSSYGLELRLTTYTLDDNYNSSSTLTVNQGTSAVTNQVTVTTGTLAIGGNLSLPGTTTTASYIAQVSDAGAGHVNVGGVITYGTNTTYANNIVTTTTGNITVTGAMTGANAMDYGTLSVTSSGTVSVAGGLTLGDGTHAPVLSEASGSILDLGGAFTNDKSGGLTFTAGANEYFTANCTVTPTTSTTFENIFINSGVTLTLAGNIIESGTWTNNSAASGVAGLTPSTNTVTFSGSYSLVGTAQTSFYNMTINSSATLSVSTSFTVTNLLTFTASSGTQSLTLSSSSVTATVAAVTQNQPTAAYTSTFAVGAGNLTVGSTGTAGTYTMTAATTTASYVVTLTATTGTISFPYVSATSTDFSFTSNTTKANQVIGLSGGAATLALGGTITNASSATITPGTTSTVNFDGTIQQTIPMGTTSGWGACTTQCYGILDVNDTNTNGAVFSAAPASGNIAGNVVIGNGSNAAVLNDSVNMVGASTATLQVNAGAYLAFTSTATYPTGFLTYSYNATSTEEYMETANATVVPATYGTLDVEPTTNANITFTLGSATGQTITVAGAFNTAVVSGATAGIITGATYYPTLAVTGGITIGANSTLTAGAAESITDKGSWTNSSSATGFTPSTSVVNFNGTTAQTIGGTYSTTFNAITDSNTTATVTNNYAISIGGALTINTSATFTSSVTITFTAGSIANSGSLTFTGVTFNGTTTNSTNSTITINGTLTVGSSGNYSPSTGTTSFANAAWTIANSGTLTLYGVTITTTPTTQPTNNFSIAGPLTVNTSQSLSPTAGTITLTGTAWTITNNGTLTFYGLTIAGTPAAQPSANFSIAGALTVNNTYTFAPTGTVTFTAGSIANSGTLTFTNVTFNGTTTNSTNSTITINGTLTVGSSGNYSPSTGTTSFANAAWTIANSGTLTLYGVTITTTPTTQPTNNFSIAGPLTVNTSQSLSPTAGTITLTGTAWTITNNGTLTFYGVVVATTPTTQPTANFSIAGPLTVNTSQSLSPTAGTITMTGAAWTITNNGTLAFYGLTYSGTSAPTVQPTASYSVAGTLTCTGVGESITPTAGTVTMTSATWQINWVSGSLGFYNLTLATTPTTQNTSGFYVTGTLTVNNGVTFAPTAGTVELNTANCNLVNNGTATFYALDLWSGTPSTQTSANFSISKYFSNSGSGTFAPTGTITFLNGSSISGNSGTLTINNMTIAASATVTTSANFNIAGALNVGSSGNFSPTSDTITLNNGASITNSGTLAFNNLSIASGATISNTASFSVSGNLANSGTSFTSTAGTVTLNNTTAASTQTLSGNSTFYNLTATSSVARNIDFTAGTTTTVSGTWTVTGASANLITLTSTSTTAWTITATTPAVSYVNVSYSNTTNPICATYSTNGGNNNANWSFSSGSSCASTVSVSGTSTNISTGTVDIAVNGTSQSQTGTITGSGPYTWTISGVTIATGNIVTVWVSGATGTSRSTGVGKYNGSGSTNMTGLVLNKDTLSIGSADNQSLSLANIANYTYSNNASIIDSDTSSTGYTLSTNTNGYVGNLSVLASNTLTPGTSDSIIAGTLANAGTVTCTGNTSFTLTATGTASADWANTGTFTPGTSTVNFTGNYTGNTINNGTPSGTNNTFYNVIFNNSSGDWTFQAAPTITNLLTLTNTDSTGVSFGGLGATLGSTSTSTGGLSMASTSTLSAGTGGGTITDYGNWTNTGGKFVEGTSTIAMDGNSVANTTITSNSNATGYHLDNLTIATSGTYNTVTSEDILNLDGNLTITTGILNDNSMGIYLAGNWTNNSATAGSFTSGTQITTFDGTAIQQIGGSTLTTFSSLTDSNVSAFLYPFTSFYVPGTLTVWGVISPAAGVFINSSAGTSTLTGTGTVQVSDITGNADFISQYVFNTYTLSGLTVQYIGTAAQTIDAKSYDNLTISPGANSLTFTLATGGTTTVTGALNLNSTAATGTIVTANASPNTAAFTVNGSFTIPAGTTYVADSATAYPLTVGGSWTNNGTFTNSSGTVNFNGTGVGGSTFGQTTASTATNNTSFTNNDAVSEFTMPTSGFISSLSVYISNVASGHSSFGAEAVIFSNVAGSPDTPGSLLATGTQMTVPDSLAMSWYSLPFTTSVYLPAGTYWLGLFAGANGGGLAWYGASGSNSQGPYANGTWPNPNNPFATYTGYPEIYDVYATYTASSSVNTINPGGTGTGHDFNNVTFNSTNGAWSFAAATNMAGNMTVNAGNSVNLNGYAIGVTGNVSNSGIITNGSTTMTVGGNYAVNSGGQTQANSSVINVAGNWTVTATNEFIPGTSTVNLTGTGTLKVPAYEDVPDFYKVTVGAASKTTSLLSSVNIGDGNLTIGTGTLSGAYWILAYINSTGGTYTPITNNGGTLSVNDVWYETETATSATTVNLIGGGTDNISMFSVLSDVSNVTYNMTGALTAGGIQELQICTASGTTGVSFNTNNNPLTVNDELLLGGTTYTGTTAVNFGSSIVTVANDPTLGLGLLSANAAVTTTLNLGTSTVYADGEWENTVGSGQINVTPGSSTVYFETTQANQSIVSGGQSFNNVNFDGTGSWTQQDAMVVNGSYTVTAGAVSTGNLPLSIAGNFSNSGTFTPGTQTTTFNGTTAQSIGGSTATAFNGLTDANTAAALSVNTNMSATGNLTLNSGSVLTPAAAVVISGTGTLLGVTPGYGTAQVTRTTSGTADFLNQYTLSNKTYTYLTIQYAGSAAQTIDALGYSNLTVTPGASSLTYTFASGTPSVSGTFNMNSNATTGTTITAATNNPTLTLTGAFTLPASTTFIASGSSILYVAGNWANSGTFTNSSGTVNLNGGTGTTQTISGTTTFNNLTATSSSARTIKFTANTTTTVSGTWTVTGTSGNLISLASTSGGTQWNIAPTAASISYANITDSSSSLAICATYSTPVPASSGNDNGNWTTSSTNTCATGVTVSGTTNASSGTVYVAVGSTLQAQTGTISSGSWSISNVTLTTGNIVTVFIYNVTGQSRSTAVGKYNGSGSTNMTGLVLTTNTLTIGSADNQTLTTANLLSYPYAATGNPQYVIYSDSGSNPYTLSTNTGGTNGNLTIQASNGLSSVTGDSITFGNLNNAGTITLVGTPSITATGNGVGSATWVNTGTFTPASSTVSFNTASAYTGQTINNGTPSGTNNTFYNVTFNSTGSDWTFQAAPTITNLLTLTNTDATGVSFGGYGAALGSATTSTGGLTMSTGNTLAAGGAGTITDYGSWTNTTGKFTCGTSTVSMSGNSAANTTITSNSTTYPFYNLTIASSGTYPTVTQQDSLFVNSNFAINTGATFSVGTMSVTVGGNWANSGTYSTGAQTTTLGISGTTAANETISGSTTTTFSSLTIASVTGGYSVLTTANILVPVTLTVNGVLAPGATYTVNASAGTSTLTGSGTAQVSRITATPDFISQYVFNTYTLTNLTVQMTGTAAQTIDATPGGSNYNNLTITPGAASTTWTFAAGSPDITGNLSLNSNGTATTTIQANTNAAILTVANAFTIPANTTFVANAANTMNVGGNWTNSGTFTNSSGTVNFNGAGTSQTISAGGTGAGHDFYNATFNNANGDWALQAATNFGGSVTVTNSGTGNGGFSFGGYASTIAGSVLVSAGELTAGGSNTITVGGNWNSSGGTGFIFNTSTVNLTGSGTVNTGTGSGQYFYNFTAAASGQVTTLSNDVRCNGVVTLGSGQITGSSYRLWMYETTSNTPFVDPSNATINLSRIVFCPNASSITMTIPGVSYGTLGYLEFYPQASGDTINITGGTLSVTGTIWVVSYAGTSLNNINTNNNNVSATGFNFGDSTANGSDTTSFGSSSVTIGSGGLTVNSNAGSHSLNMGTAAISDAGSWIDDNGTGTLALTPGNSIVSMIGNTTGNTTITTNGQSFNGLAINNAQGTYKTVTQNDALNLTNGGSNSGFTLTSGIYNASSLAINDAGNWSVATGTTLTLGTQTVTMNNTLGSQSIGGTTATAFSSLTLGNGTNADVVSVNYNMSVAGTLTVSTNATLSPAIGVVISGGGTLLGQSNTTSVAQVTGTVSLWTQYTMSTQTLTNLMVQYTSTGGQAMSGAAYSNVEITPLATSGTWSFTGSPTVSGTFNMNTNNTAGTIVSLSTNNATLSMSGSLTIPTNTTLVASSTSNFFVGGSWTNNGTFTSNSGTVTMNGTSVGNTINEGTSSFYNLSFNGTGGTWSALTNTLLVTGTFKMWAGTFNSAAGNYNVTVNGTVACGTTCGIINTTAGTFTQNTSVNQNFGTNVAGDSTAWTFYNLTFSGGQYITTSSTPTSPGSITISNNLTIGASTQLNSGSDSRNWILAGTGSPFTNSGTLVSAGINSTFTYTGTTTATTVTAAPYYNLVLTPTATTTYSLGGSLTGANAIGGSLTISNSYATLNTTGSSFNMAVAGNWANSGTFTANSDTVSLTGAAASTQTISGTTSFNNLTATSSSARTIDFTAGTTTTVTGTWTVTGAASNLIMITSTNTSAWTISPTVASISYADVDYSTSNLAICATYSQTTNGGNNANWHISSGSSCSPNAPTALTQGTTSGTNNISQGAWTNDNTPYLGFNVVDPGSYTVKYQIEVDGTSNAFNNLVLNYTYSTLTASGTTFAYQVGQSGGTYTVGSTSMTLPDSSTGYWWRVSAINSIGYQGAWTVYNTSTNFMIDTSAPTGMTVYDGSTTGVETPYNNGSITQLSANWTAPNFAISGAPTTPYSYAIGSTPGGTDIKGWTATSATSSTDTSLNLNTSTTYYYTIKATDNAGNVETVTSSGQWVSATFNVSLSSNTVNMGSWNAADSFNSTGQTTVTTTTNASNGYSVYMYKTQALALNTNIAKTIADITAGWSAPAAWPSTCTTGCFGYTSNDPSVQGSNRFDNGLYYAYINNTAPGDIVADETVPEPSGESWIITYQVTTAANLPAGAYSTNLIYSDVPNY